MMSYRDEPFSPQRIAEATQQLIEMLQIVRESRLDFPGETIWTRERVAAVAEAAIEALQAASRTKCTLASPPKDINTRPQGPDGELIMRCEHDPAHCWSFTGKQIACP
jgi:hypothetical protein